MLMTMMMHRGSSDLLTCKKLRDTLPSDKIRLFHVQQKLFEFIDTKNTLNSTSSNETGDATLDPWLPFSIELDSETTVQSTLQRAGLSLSALLDGLPSIFRRPTATVAAIDVDDPSAEDGSGIAPYHHHERVSEQTRFFIAIRRSFVYEFHCTLPLHQQHLYEIIREGAPCHFYLDVEQDSDFCDPQAIQGSSGTGSGGDSLPWGYCALTCPCRPNHTHTTDLLLWSLNQYLSLRRDITDVNGRCLSTSRAKVIIMRSVALNGDDTQTKKKFSQHYIIHFDDVVFSDNRDVGVLVRDFVDWLTTKSATDANLHAALFFHAERKLVLQHHKEALITDTAPTPSKDSAVSDPIPTLAPTSSSSSMMLLPRKCIIDTAVYSRNRMFRCYGSTKLGKDATLMLDPDFYHSTRCTNAFTVHHAETEEMFRATLISLDAVVAVTEANDIKTLFLQNQPPCTPTKTHSSIHPTTSRGHTRETMKPLPSPFPQLDMFMQRVLLDVPTKSKGIVTHFSLLTNTQQHMDVSPSMVSAVLYHVEGSRYCHNVGREHKSNGVYYVASLGSRTICQKCFDPDCRHYRSPVVTIPESVVISQPATVPTAQADLSQCSTPEPVPFYMIDSSEALRAANALRTKVVLKRKRNRSEDELLNDDDDDGLGFEKIDR